MADGKGKGKRVKANTKGAKGALKTTRFATNGYAPSRQTGSKTSRAKQHLENIQDALKSEKAQFKTKKK